MKALSIRQPWAWAILHAGKDIENRDWKGRNPGLRFRGRFLIHASKCMTLREYDDFFIFAGSMSRSDRRTFPYELVLPAPEDLDKGGIVGIGRIVDVVTASASPWFTGKYGLVLADVRPLPFVPCAGKLGFFDVPAGVMTALRWRNAS